MAHTTGNREAAGSIPASPTNLTSQNGAEVAQGPHKSQVGSSILPSATKKGFVFMKKLIPGFDPVYYADEEGNIYRNDKKLSPVDNGLGYQKIKLRLNGIRYNRYVHRLV